jgi:hypothetical protein
VLRRARASLVVVTCSALLLGAATHASGGLPKLLADGPHFSLTWQVRPAHIVYTGDGSGVLGGFDGTGIAHPGHLAWSSWTATRARGSGAVWIDNCTPSCAGGKFTAYSVAIVASRTVKGRFTRLTLTYKYKGKRVVDKRGIVFHAGSWMYDIVGSP